MKKKIIRVFIYFYRNSLSKEHRILIKKIFKFFYYKMRFFKLKIYLDFTNRNVNLILGAALTKQKGWFSTNEEWLDITQERNWDKLFDSKKRVRRVLAEHVFEHLTLEEMRNSLRIIYNNMILGGTLRIAVPDGNNPNYEYRKHCGINGIGADASDHKQFITFELLSDELSKIGFQVKLVEGYLKNKNLISEDFDDDLGFVMRSRKHLNKCSPKDGWNFQDANSSLIVDCLKMND